MDKTKIKYRVRCNHCSNYQEYNPRSIQKIPSRPDTRCNNCNRKIRINRADLIKYINNLTSKSGGWGKKRKNLRGENLKKGKIWGKLKILKLLGQGFYAQEICEKTSFSAKKISQIAKWLKDNNFIVQTQKYPKKYNLTDKGKYVLKFPHFSEKDVEKEKNIQEEKKIIPEWLEKTRSHCLRFKNGLVQRPSWLGSIARKAIVNGLTIDLVKMNNWTKYLVKFNYQQFNGIDSVEIGTDGYTAGDERHFVVYNLKKNTKDQYIYSGESIRNYLSDRIDECKQARAFLEQKGFVIDQADPILAQDGHYAFLTRGDPKLIGSLGQYLKMVIKSPTSETIIDDSPKNGGEEETTDIDKAQSVLDIPQKIDNINLVLNQIVQTQNNYNQIIQNLTKTQEKIALSLSQMTSIFQNTNKDQGMVV